MPEPPAHVIHWDWEPLPDDAVVVRGGPMTNENLAYNAASVFLDSGLRGICVGAGPVPAAAEDVAAGMPYRGQWISESTLGKLRRLGFDLVMVDEPTHAVLLLKSEALDADWEGWDRLREVFTAPRRLDN